MSPDVVLALAREAAWTALAVTTPLLGVILVTGVVVSVLQAVTQVQELTLTFVPKVAAVLAVLFALGHWMLSVVLRFMTTLLTDLPTYAR